MSTEPLARSIAADAFDGAAGVEIAVVVVEFWYELDAAELPAGLTATIVNV